MMSIVALVHNPAFRQFILRIAHTRLIETIGLDLRMRDFSVRLSGWSPAIDMYDVIVAGAAPYENPPVLQIDHFSLEARIVSLIQRKWYLRDAVIDHPVARVLLTKDGRANLPSLKGAAQNLAVFVIGVRHLTLVKGEIYYNDRKSLLDTDLHNLEFRGGFDPGKRRYSGAFSYKDAKIRSQNFKPIIHNLEAEFDAASDRVDLKHGLLTSSVSQVRFAATLNDYSQPKVTAEYQLTLDTRELRRILKEAPLPDGIVKMIGSAKFESGGDAPILQKLTLNGGLSSGGLHIDTTTMHTLVRNITARYALQDGDAEFRELKAEVLGGRIDGSLEMHDVTGAQASELHAVFHDVALASVQTLADPKSARNLHLTGTANAAVEARWRKAFGMLTLHTDATLKGAIVPSRSVEENPANVGVPFEGDVHGDYSAAAQTVSSSNSLIRTPHTHVRLNGTVSHTASLEVQVRSDDLREIETAAGIFGVMPQPLGLAGAAAFTGTVRGSAADPQINGIFSATSLKVKETEWHTVRTNLEARPSRVALSDAELIPANRRGRFTFDMDVGLDQWVFRNTSPIRLNLVASQMDLSGLKRLAGVQAPVAGSLDANVSLHGSEMNLIGHGAITLTQATLFGEPVQSARLDFQGTGGEIRARLGLQLPAGKLDSTFTYFPKQRAYNGQLQATGVLIDQLPVLHARHLNLTGTLNLTAKGNGTLDNPGVQLKAQMPRLALGDQTLSGILLEADVTNHVATVALDSQAQALNVSTFVRGRGRINLTGDYETETVFDSSSISLLPLIAAYFPAQSPDLTGQMEIHATIKGPLKNKEQLNARLTIPTLWLKYKNKVELAAAEPVQLDYTKGVLTFQKTAIRGAGTDLEVEGTIPFATTAPISLLAQGTVDLGVAQLLYPDITSSGRMLLNIAGTGRGATKNVQGHIEVVDAAVSRKDLFAGLQNGNGFLTLTNNRLEIDSFQGKVSGGTVKITGGVTYWPSPQFNLALTANGVRTSQAEGIHEGLDANLVLVGSSQSAVLRGQARLTEVSFSPSFDFSEVTNIVGRTRGLTVPPDSFLRKVNLEVSMASSEDLNLATSKFSLQGTANLRIRGTAAEPAATGRVNLTGGDLVFRGNRYFIEPSTIDFVDPYGIEPRLNLAVSTKVQDYDIRLTLRGSMDRLRTTYSSEPALPPADIINLLVFGNTAAFQTANPTLRNPDAQSLIASSVASQITNPVENIVGISRLSIDPVLGSNQTNPTARVTIQQRMTANLFVTFATDAASTQRQVIKLEYQATPRFAISGVRDQNGGFAFDIRLRKTW